MAYPTVVCVLRRGGPFTPVWVARLRDQCARHLPPHKFCCLADQAVPVPRIPLKYAWPGFYSKFELFRPGALGGRVVYFDLDTLLVANAAPLFDYQGPFAALSDFLDPGMVASGVMAWDADATDGLWARLTDPMPEFRGRSDYPLNRALGSDVGRLQDLFPGLIGSYKADGLEGGPKDYSVVCFHGEPKQHELPDGHWARAAWEDNPGWRSAA